MIRITITSEAFAAIEATLPLGLVAVEPRVNEKGEREIWLDQGVFNRPARGELPLHAGPLMPRGGAVTLSDVREPSLVIICEPCGRRGRHNVERLIAEHGDAKLTYLLMTLADCPKAHSVSVHEPMQGGTRGFRCGLKNVSAR